jgi:pentatricopeptide repeat protein
MAILAQIQTAEAPVALLGRIFHAARFEIVFVAVLMMIYLLFMASRVKSRPKGRAPVPKKERGNQRIPDREDRSNATRRPGDKRHQAGEIVATSSDGKLALNQIDLDVILQGNETRRLCDPTWLIPRLIDTCQTDAPQALLVLRKARDAGLDLASVSISVREQLFIALVTSMIRLNRYADAKQLLEELRSLDASSVSPNFRTSLVKLCTAKQAFQEALSFFDMCSSTSDDPQDKSIWSCLLFCSVEMKAFHRCRDLFARLKESGVPSQKDYWNMIRCGSAKGDWSAMLRLIEEMHQCNVEADNVIYNTTLAGCVAADQVEQARRLLDEMETKVGVTDVITYNTIMKGYAKIGKMDSCFQIYELMQERGHAPSPVTYGILLDGYINDNDVENAANVFSTMQSNGCPMNTVLYTTLIKGFAREGKVDKAMELYNQMIGQNGATPDLVTYSILLKANCDAGQLEQALSLLDSMVKGGLKPDEVIFNNLLAGCAVTSKVELAKQIYNDMIESHVKPSNATFSILIRLYSGSKLLDEAVTMLKAEPLKHHVPVEPRLYVQLITSCIRTRQGRRAVDVCELMYERSKPTPASMSTILGAATKLNMYDTAADFLACSAKHAGRIDARDANMVLHSAQKKKKEACVESCLASMKALKIAVRAAES